MSTYLPAWYDPNVMPHPVRVGFDALTRVRNPGDVMFKVHAPDCPCRLCVSVAVKPSTSEGGEEEMKIGDPCVFVDEHGQERAAVVTAVQGSGPTPSVNLVYVSPDASREDSYGRQIERAASVVYKASQPAHGNYWREAA